MSSGLHQSRPAQIKASVPGQRWRWRIKRVATPTLSVWCWAVLSKVTLEFDISNKSIKALQQRLGIKINNSSVVFLLFRLVLSQYFLIVTSINTLPFKYSKLLSYPVVGKQNGDGAQSRRLLNDSLLWSDWCCSVWFCLWAGWHQAAKSFFEITGKKNKGFMRWSWPRPHWIPKLPDKGEIWVWLHRGGGPGLTPSPWYSRRAALFLACSAYFLPPSKWFHCSMHRITDFMGILGISRRHSRLPGPRTDSVWASGPANPDI